jgi:hypothetical protein
VGFHKLKSLVVLGAVGLSLGAGSAFAGDPTQEEIAKAKAAIAEQTGLILIGGETYRVQENGILKNTTTGALKKISNSNTLVDYHAKGEEYRYNGKTYYSVQDARDAGLNKLSDAEAANVKIAKYDNNGNLIPGSEKTLADERKGALASKSGKDSKEKKEKDDDCKASYQYALDNNLPNAEQYRCSKTNMVAKGAETANQVLNTAGRDLVNQMGSKAAASAQTQNGTAIGGQEAVAKMAKTAKSYESALGVANIAAAAILGKQAAIHKENAAALQPNGDKNSLAYNQDTAAMAQEQTNARNTAATAAMASAIVAAKSVAGAYVADKNQKNAEANIRIMKENAAKESALTFGYNPNQLGLNGGVNEFDPNRLAGATNGTLSNTDDGTELSDDPGPMLGSGTDLGGGEDGILAPTPGVFKPGSQSGAGGGAGGGGGGLAGGGGGGGPSEQEDPKAAYASEFSAKDRYESAGAAAGAKGGAKGKDDGGIDLNGLLAQFLPKADDEASKHSILDSVSFNGARNVAGEEPASYLDKNADLFQRIHETMNEKNRKGQVGI